MSTQPLRAFHGDPAVKAKYLGRVRAHAAADRLTQGIGWQNGKGCAIGCTLKAYDHSRYPVELGLPEWLARLEDSIFEGLPKDEAMVWPESFLEAITPGVNVEPVRHQLAILRIGRLIALQQGNAGKHGEAIDAVIAQAIAALEQVRRCHEAEIGGNVCDLSAAWSAESAARSAESAAAWSAARSAVWSAESAAARSAESAARSAAWSAESRSAAWSAESAAAWSAESAARSAVWSAESAARSAESAAWRQEAADLLRLLRECAP